MHFVASYGLGRIVDRKRCVKRSIHKQTILPLEFSGRGKVSAEMHGLMDRGLLRRHLYESSTLEELNLSYVPYWIVSASARSSIVASDVAVHVVLTVAKNRSKFIEALFV